jgi:hypothetical protein
MSGSEWLARLTGDGGLNGVDPEWFSGLARADLQSLQIDERGRSLTATFTTAASPQDAVTATVHDAVEFFVVFSEVAELAIRGWSHEAAHTYSMGAAAGGRRTVTIEGGGTVVTFSCEDLTVEQVRTFRSGPV